MSEGISLQSQHTEAETQSYELGKKQLTIRKTNMHPQ